MSEKKDFERLKNIFGLWVLGVVALSTFTLILLGVKMLSEFVLRAYGLIFLLAGTITIPILISLFILPKSWRDNWGVKDA